MEERVVEVRLIGDVFLGLKPSLPVEDFIKLFTDESALFFRAEYSGETHLIPKQAIVDIVVRKGETLA